MQLPINTTLQEGKYRIVRFINSGGFGCTYEAEYALMDSRVAIKEFFVKDLCERDESTSHISVLSKSKVDVVEKLKKKFIEEARALFKMHHPGIVRVTDIFEENGTAYYAMEYIEGTSLHDVIKTQGALSEAEALQYIRQVCEALRYVHGKNRLHLDIKPGNIMVDTEGKAILIDFGASKHYNEETGENTSTLMGINTRGYAPPEQTTQSFTSFSPSTDIYAVGATLYKLLTGVTPPDSVSIMTKDKTLVPLPNNISASTRYATERALQSVRADRPQSVDEFLKLLDSNNITHTTHNESTIIELKQESPNQKPSSNSQPQPSKKETFAKNRTTSPSPKKNRKGLKIILTTIVILALAALAFFTLRKSPSEKIVALYEEATEQVAQANDLDELKEIDEDLTDKIDEVESDDNYDPSKEEERMVERAMKAYKKAYEKRLNKVATVAERMIVLLEETTEQIKRAKSKEDLENISKEMMGKGQALEKEWKEEEYEFTQEEEKAVGKAVEEYFVAYRKKAEECEFGPIYGATKEAPAAEKAPAQEVVAQTEEAPVAEEAPAEWEPQPAE